MIPSLACLIKFHVFLLLLFFISLLYFRPAAGGRFWFRIFMACVPKFKFRQSTRIYLTGKFCHNSEV